MTRATEWLLLQPEGGVLVEHEGVELLQRSEGDVRAEAAAEGDQRIDSGVRRLVDDCTG